MIRKGLAVGLILLLIGTSVIPITAQDIEKQSQPTLSGNWLYVGGSGPGNYTRIQDAIDNTSVGDTVFVYRGHYNETISINKSIFVYGEERDMTFIGHGDFPYTSVGIAGDNVEFKRFTIQNGGHGIVIRNCWGIQVAENYVGPGLYGIMILNSDSVIVSNNTIQENDIGISIENSKSVIVSNNTIQKNNIGISIENSKNVTIKGNVIDGDGTGRGIRVVYTMNFNRIVGNTLTNNLYGIFLMLSRFTIVFENNFLQNNDWPVVNTLSFFNLWLHNYWGRPHLLPLVLFGMPPIIDLRPALKPFDVGG